MLICATHELVSLIYEILKGAVHIHHNAPVNVYPHYPPPGLSKVRPGILPYKKPLSLGRIPDQIPYFRDSTVNNTTQGLF